jgi:hypothetical protein
MAHPQTAARGAALTIVSLLAFAATSDCAPAPVAPTLALPPRPAGAPGGSEIARLTAGLSSDDRQRAFVQELERGNVPTFLRHLRPVELTAAAADHSGPVTATVFVLPDYLAVGSDDDFLYVPLDYYSATEVADRLACVLPTTRIVDAVYAESAEKLSPVPLPAGPLMRSNEWLMDHQHRIDKQRAGLPVGELIAGHKKDVVVTNRLLGTSGKVAIYGWHRGVGDPIQPLCTWHGARYADYSHGVRLVSQTAIVNGEPRSVYDVLKDSRLAPVLSDEGATPGLWTMMHPDPSPRGAASPATPTAAASGGGGR